MSTDTVVRINGVDRPDARRAGLGIHEILGPNPNTARVSFGGSAPAAGATLDIVLTTESPDHVLFSGEVQAVAQSYDLQEENQRWDVDAIDPSFKANRRRPFGTYVNTSATTIAVAIATAYAPACTRAGIAAGLAAIDINFDGQQPFMAAWQALANAVGNGCRATISYANDLGLFITDTGETPTPLDDAHPPLNDPPIRFSQDLSQVRTRVYGKGISQTIIEDAAVQVTTLPLDNAASFNPAGGSVIAGLTAGAAQTMVLTYTGTDLGGQSTTVGDGQNYAAGSFNTGAPFDALGHIDNGDTSTPTFTDANGGYTFTSVDIGATLYLKSGTSIIPGRYLITGLSSGNAVIAGPCATAGSTLTGVTWGVDYSTQSSPRATSSGGLAFGTSTTQLEWPALSLTGGAADAHWYGNSITITAGTGFTRQQVTISFQPGTGRFGVSAILGVLGSTGGSGFLGSPVSRISAGATSLLVVDATNFSSSGGWAVAGSIVIRYTGKSGNTLTGIPASGTGSITAAIPYGTTITTSPALLGVGLGFSPDGLPYAMAKGSTVAIWVQRDDAAAQTALAALEGGDGIREDTFFDGRFGEDLLIQTCDALLEKFGTITVSVAYATLDRTQARIGSAVPIDLTAGFYDPAFYDSAFYDAIVEGFAASYIVQDVQIGFIGALMTPVYSVQASSVAFTVMDLFRLTQIGQG